MTPHLLSCFQCRVSYHTSLALACLPTGKTVCVASSKVLYLCQGARFRVRYEDDRTGEKQEGELTWHGMRVQVL